MINSIVIIINQLYKPKKKIQTSQLREANINLKLKKTKQNKHKREKLKKEHRKPRERDNRKRR